MLNFSDNIQNIIDTYYLQPMNGNKKKLCKDGNIERTIHGALHVSRAASWALIMHNFLKANMPQNIKNALKHISALTKIKSNEENIAILLFTVFCHDAARKGEGQDLWEAESAEIAYEKLKALGLNEQAATALAFAIKYKDDRSGYLRELKKLGIENPIPLDYIRVFVNLGDNLDLIRCKGNFQSSYIFNTLSSLAGFDVNVLEQPILKLILAIGEFIYQQHDILFDCDIKDRQGKIIRTYPARVSNKIKALYEHAENIFSVLIQDLLINKEFEPYLQSDFLVSIPFSKKYSGNISFDPFIHGTNSSIFAILPKSGWRVMSPLKMIDECQAAPMSGELVGGGYSNAGEDIIERDLMGATSFAKMEKQNLNSYCLEKILTAYTKFPLADKTENMNFLLAACNRGLSVAFSNINLILIYLTQARQYGLSLQEIQSNPLFRTIETQLEGTRQYFYFIQLLGEHIHPDIEAYKRQYYQLANKLGLKINSEEIDTIKDINDLKKYPDFYRIFNPIKQHLTFEYIVNKIMQKGIDMKAIVENPSEENIKKAIEVLALPDNLSIEIELENAGRTSIVLSENLFFGLKRDYRYKEFCMPEPPQVFKFIVKNDSSADGPVNGHGNLLNHHLACFFVGLTTPEFFIELGVCIAKYLIAFEDRMRVIKKIFSANDDVFTISPSGNFFLKNPYPIVLISENEEAIQIDKLTTHEYRSLLPLKLGKDIRMITTDSEIHRLEIMKFLNIHDVKGVLVILFDDLKKSVISKKAPTSPYQHQDGFVKLQRLAASCCHSEKLSFFKANKPKDVNQLKSAERQAQELIDDTEEYARIEF